MAELTWNRHRFYTRADDYRPIVFNKSYPWWCSGEAIDGGYHVIVAFLPKTEPLERYWDDAFNVDSQECDGPSFSSRFPQPDYYVPPESSP